MRSTVLLGSTIAGGPVLRVWPGRDGGGSSGVTGGVGSAAGGAAGAAGVSGAGAGVGGAEQGAAVRPAVGEDEGGAAVRARGPRADARLLAGRAAGRADRVVRAELRAPVGAGRVGGPEGGG